MGVQHYWGDSNLDFEKVKKRAHQIASWKFDNFDEAMMCIINRLSEYYKIPVFSEYFQNRTPHQLVFELELISYRGEKGRAMMERASFESSKEELDNLFNDWESDEGEWAEVAEADSSEIDEISKKFMETGEFQEKD